MEFEEVRNEVMSLHTALHELQEEAEDEDSVLSRADRAGKGRKRNEFRLIITNCTKLLRDLENIAQKYRSLGTDRKAILDRLRLDRDAIKDIRTKLVLHTTTLTQFMTALNTGSLGRLERGQDEIIQKIDEVAADVRAGVRQPSILSSVEDESGFDQGWASLSKNLLEEFPQDQVEQNKPAIKAYVRNLMDHGQLDQQTVESSTSTSRPTSSRTESSLGASKNNEPKLATSNTNLSADIPIRTSKSQDLKPSGSEIPPQSDPQEKVDLAPVMHPKAALPSAETPRFHVHLGINIGTDTSQLAICGSDGSLEFIANEQVYIDISTCIAFTKTNTRIGHVADLWPDRPNVFKGFLHLLGENYDSEIVAKVRETTDIRCRDGKPFFYVPCRKTCFSPEQLLAAFIRGLIESVSSALRCPIEVKSLALSLPESYIFLKRQSLAKACPKDDLPPSPSICHQTLANAFQWVQDEPSLLKCRDFDRLLSISYSMPFIQYALIEASSEKLTIDRIDGHRWCLGKEFRDCSEHIFNRFTKFLQKANWRPSTARVLLVASGPDTLAVQDLISRHICKATTYQNRLRPNIDLEVFGADQTCKGLALHAARPFCAIQVPSLQPYCDEICGFAVLIRNYRIIDGKTVPQPPIMLRHLNHLASERFPRIICPLKDQQPGILLQVSTPLGPPPDFLDSKLLFEVAIPLPPTLVQTDALHALKLNLRFLSVDDFEMEIETNFTYDMTVFHVHHDACGFLHVLRGRTVPITPEIRKDWLIQAVDWQGR
ncbi:MAG: hypothetical protein Q9227_002568 [Pyrenula ochraceoflavens]